MSRRIIKSDLALNDLEEQAEYIRQDNPRAALRFLGQEDDSGGA
jgi:plasmid stabilization system protein ParE